MSCGGCDEGATGGPGTGFDTSSCQTDADCIGTCSDGTCEGGGSTGFDGEECSADDECRGTCEAGTCTGAGTGEDGTECSSDAECLGTCEEGTCSEAPDDPTNNGTNNTSNNTGGTNNATNNGAGTNNAATNNTNTGSGTTFCDGNPCACDDGIDNDGDGLVDGQDPECTAPQDNDEGTFATGIPGDNVDFCQDCFFDGDSGEGNDGCRYHTNCLTGEAPPMGGGGCFDCDVSEQCLNTCRPATPNGCDCFGCCEVFLDDGSSVRVRLEATCTLDTIEDETACPRCVQDDECINECGRCELCTGKTIDDLPDDCSPSSGGGDGGDGATCTVDGDCAGGECESGTCTGDGSGGDGDPCTVDGDCAGTSTCDSGTCSGGGGGGDDPGFTCDDGEQVCTISADCPSDQYCNSGCCLQVIN